MAIFVSNPPSAAVPTLSSDALEPSAVAPEEGFTEELAAAMQPSAAPTDASAKPLLDKLEEVGKKASDLQILPAEVLMNTVGDANFAFIEQSGVVNSSLQNSAPRSALSNANETFEQDNIDLDLANPLQGAELAAANLAAQMSASAANVTLPVPVPLVANPGEVSAALSIRTNSVNGKEAGQALQGPATGSGLQEGEQVISAAHLASPQNTSSLSTESIQSANVLTGSQPAHMAAVATTAAEQASLHAGAQVDIAPSLTLNSEASSAITNVSTDTKADAQASQAQESAFNFDANLAKSEAEKNPKVLETAVSLSHVAKSSAQLQPASLTSNGKDLGVQTATPTSALTSAQIRTPVASASSTTVANSNSAVMAQEAPRAETTQSLEDISSSFVSSLVGGPQRPVTTVMDWISMQSQERPAPLVPHEVRLDAGAVQMEIQKMVKQGGGHVVMELTPPDQSKFTIELKLDERGNALLIVEGVSDSTKTRLEQSAPQLREQFQQMGLELQLDMRQQGQSASSNAANFADSKERGSSDNNLASNGAGDMPKVLTQREAGANRARETGSNQVYLYA